MRTTKFIENDASQRFTTVCITSVDQLMFQRRYLLIHYSFTHMLVHRGHLLFTWSSAVKLRKTLKLLKTADDDPFQFHKIYFMAPYRTFICYIGWNWKLSLSFSHFQWKWRITWLLPEMCESFLCDYLHIDTLAHMLVNLLDGLCFPRIT